MAGKVPDFDGTQICLQVDPEAFFPDTNDRLAIKMAKEICMGCHFRIPCLEYAVSNPDFIGIWGGTTPRQRQEIRSLRRRSVA